MFNFGKIAKFYFYFGSVLINLWIATIFVLQPRKSNTKLLLLQNKKQPTEQRPPSNNGYFFGLLSVIVVEKYF